MADHKLPRELMESCLAASQEATFAGFDDSVLASEFADPKRRRLMETIYRMGFESGWRIREQQIAHGVKAVQPWEIKVHCSKGERTLRAGMRWTDSLHGGTWEVVEPNGTRSYSPSGFGGTPSFWCRFVGEPAQHKYRDYARDDGCVEFCGDSIAAGLTRAAGVAEAPAPISDERINHLWHLKVGTPATIAVRIFAHALEAEIRAAGVIASHGSQPE